VGLAGRQMMERDRARLAGEAKLRNSISSARSPFLPVTR
jgi:hypothetical protein